MGTQPKEGWKQRLHSHDQIQKEFAGDKDFSSMLEYTREQRARSHYEKRQDVEEESESIMFSETPDPPSGRRQLLICILVSLFSLESVMMNVTTIIPNYVASKHISL